MHNYYIQGKTFQVSLTFLFSEGSKIMEAFFLKLEEKLPNIGKSVERRIQI